MIYYKPTKQFFKNRLEARKHFAWYLRGVAYANYYKEKISGIQKMEDIYQIAEGIRRDLK